MSNSEHPLGNPASKRVRCTFGPGRDVDLVWPPPTEELDACSVIQLDENDARPPSNAAPRTALPPDVAALAGAAVTPTAPDDAGPSIEPTPAAPLPVATSTPDEPLSTVASTAADVRKSTASTPAPAARVPARPAFGNDGRTPVKLALGNDPRRAVKPTFGDCRAPGVAPRIQFNLAPPAPAEPPALAGLPTLAQPSALAQPPALAVPPDVAVPPALTEEPPPLPPTFLALTEPPPIVMRPAEVDSFDARLDLRRVDEVVPFPLIGRPPVPDAATNGAGRSAWLALFVAASCALVTYAEFRAVPASTARTVAALLATPAPKPAPVLAAPVEARPAPEPLAPAPMRMPEPIAIPNVQAPRQVPRAVAAAARPTLPAPVVDRAPARRVDAAKTPAPLRAAPPVLPTPPPVTVAVRDRGVADPAPPRISTPLRQDAPVAAATTAPAAAPAAAVALPAPEAALALAPTPTPTPLTNPTPTPPKPVAAVVADEAGDDEAHIRTTLTRFRTAYSQLNASAAREVWPSVDARALERAFQGLKSQDLRFDSCNLTVNGARAHAACKGRAIYVPRVGDQSPRRTSREWTFELRKADEGWTIASARSL